MSRGLVALAVTLAAVGTASAEPLTVGVFAPSTPFAGTAARLEFAKAVAVHVGGPDAVGRVYGRSADFASAAARGEIQLAVVDATYLATASLAHTPLAVAVADGDASVGWQLIARTGITTILELRGRTVLAPVGDGQHTAFVDHALLGGELAPGFWRVEPSPDAASAVAAVGLGKADAAVAPLGLALPGGVVVVAALPSVSRPIAIALKAAPPEVVAAARARLPSFSASGPINGFRAAGGDAYRGLARRLRRIVRQAPLIVPNLRLAVDALLDGRRFAIATAPVTDFFRRDRAPARARE
jgi:ABC-type amino acid transport substrate-binding protein